MKYKEIKIQDKTIRGFLHEGTGHDIVCIIHGFMGNKADHHFMLRTFGDDICQEGFSVYRFDFLGSGDSDGSFFEEESIKSQIEQCQYIVRQFQKENYKVHLFAFSLGGVIASHVAKKMNVESLFLLSPAGNFDEILFQMTRDSMDESNLEVNGFKINPKLMEESKNFEYFSGIDRYRGPIKIVQGTEDQYVTMESLDNYKKAYTGAEVVLIPDADHCFSRISYTESVRKEVHDFYGRIKNLASKE